MAFNFTFTLCITLLSLLITQIHTTSITSQSPSKNWKKVDYSGILSHSFYGKFECKFVSDDDDVDYIINVCMYMYV